MNCHLPSIETHVKLGVSDESTKCKQLVALTKWAITKAALASPDTFCFPAKATADYLGLQVSQLLSRQRSQVRALSSPPYFPEKLDVMFTYADHQRRFDVAPVDDPPIRRVVSLE